MNLSSSRAPPAAARSNATALDPGGAGPSGAALTHPRDARDQHVPLVSFLDRRREVLAAQGSPASAVLMHLFGSSVNVRTCRHGVFCHRRLLKLHRLGKNFSID
jgi:hypothetical protein